MDSLHSGRELRWCQLDGIRLSETLMPAGLRLPAHTHEPGQICFVLEGEYVETMRGGKIALRPGSVQYHAPGEAHANRFSDDDVLALLVSFEPRRWMRIRRERPLLSELDRELWSLDAEALESWAMLTMSRLAEPEWLADAASLIDRRYAEKLALSTIAETIGVHRATLAAAFRRYRRLSVGEAIGHARVARARDLLGATTMPLAEVAFQCGFHDQAHFSRVFRSLTGLTPGAFRRAGSDLRLECALQRAGSRFRSRR